MIVVKKKGKSDRTKEEEMHEATEWTVIQTSLVQWNDSKVSGISVVVDQVGLDIRDDTKERSFRGYASLHPAM